MTSIILEEQLIPLNKIINKNIKSVTFKETISLIFYAAILLSNDTTHPDKNKWKELYEEYKKESDKQNNLKWPIINIIKNDYNKRIDIFSINSSFLSSKNFFMLLQRLLYIENYKRPYIFKTYEYHKILGHKIKNNDNTPIRNISLMDLFELLKKHLKYYIQIYNNEKKIEYQLANKIMKQID